MPVCNNEKYLSESIESILNQTYKNIELLILDDGSMDNSLSIIEKYALNNKCIKIISRDNKGISNSINELFKYVNGKYIARMSGDDVSYPNRIEMQVEYLNKNQDTALVGCLVDIEISDYKNEDDKIMCEKIFNFKIDKNNPIIKILNGHRICHGTFFMRADLLRKVNYDVKLKNVEDLDFIFKLIEGNFKFDIIQKKLYLNRVNSNFIHQQKDLDCNYNKEDLFLKIKFIEGKIGNREIIIFGKTKCSKILSEIIHDKFNIKIIENFNNIDDLKKYYIIILDKHNSEEIENQLIAIGKINLNDFITL